MTTVAIPSRQRPATQTTLRVELLGGFRLTVGGTEVRVPEGSQRLVVFLALRERPQPRMYVAGNLWPEKTDERATANLRSALWRCRIEDGRSIVVPDGSSLRLDPSIELDVTEMESGGWGFLRDSDLNRIDAVDRHIFHRSLLPGWYDDWVVFERERLAQLQLHFLEGISNQLRAAGRVVEAEDLSMRRRQLAEGV